VQGIVVAGIVASFAEGIVVAGIVVAGIVVAGIVVAGIVVAGIVESIVVVGIVARIVESTLGRMLLTLLEGFEIGTCYHSVGAVAAAAILMVIRKVPTSTNRAQTVGVRNSSMVILRNWLAVKRRN